MPLTPAQLQTYRGHPTASGPNEEYVARRGGPSPGNGQPGVPRLQPRPESKGPGVPGQTPAGPLQPGVFYDNEDEETNP